MIDSAMPSDETLKFCIVSTFYPPFNFGGDGVYAYRLANGLARRGHEVTVLHSPAAYEMAAGKKPDGDYDDHANVTVAPIGTPLGSLGLLAVQQTGRPCFQGRALRRWLKGRAYDVIHYNNVSLLGGPHVFRYGDALKFCTLIEHWLVCPMHVLWRMDREVCTKPTCLRCTLHGRRPPQWWRYTGLMKRATRHIDAYVGPSMFTMDMHRQRGIPGTMVQLPLFHDAPVMEVDDLEAVNAGRPYFLFVGRLEKIKGAQTIIPVFAEHPEVDLLIAGDGHYESALRELAAGAGNIRFVGRADHRRLHSLYSNAVATVVPSLCYETFGIIVSESWAGRTPVIVRAASSLEELVDTHGGGLKYETKDELRGAIRRMIDDAALRRRLGEEGRAAYESEFASEAFIEHYLDVATDLLAKRRSGESLTPAAADAGRGMLAGRRVLWAQDD